jgi:hypothetical protein
MSLPLLGFRRTSRRGPWFVEVDFGDGWAVYGPVVPLRATAEGFARDLGGRGRRVRVGEGEPPDEEPSAQKNAAGPRKRRRRRRRH